MKKYIIFAVAAMAFAACTNEEEILDDSPVAVRISAGVSTRAIDDMWEQDQIGVMVTGGNATMAELYKNVWYHTDATGTDKANFTAYHANSPIYFKGTEEATFAAYGPYEDSSSSASDELPGNEGVIAGSTTDQDTRDRQKAFDYIYASGAKGSLDKPKVDFTFRHVMARLVINVTTSASDGFAATDVTSGEYYLNGLKHDGKFDVTTGTAEADGNVVDNWLLNDNTIKEVSDSDDKMTFTAILYPQTLSSALGFEAKINGQTYKIGISPALEAGYSYSYNITVKKTGLTVDKCTIQDWTSTSAVDADATM